MKRFYKNATARATEGGYEILLDERPVKTPARARLLASTERLGAAIAEEWNKQGEKVDPRSMPLTGLANAAIDRVEPERDAFAKSLAQFGESDLLCYRADKPDALAERQAEIWDPLLAWARQRFDIDFELVCGIIHRPQPASTVDRLAKAVAARNPFELAALAPLVTISGSLLIALALAEGAVDPEAAWSAATLDEAWQAEQWGHDEEAAEVMANRRRDFEAGYEFLKLL